MRKSHAPPYARLVVLIAHRRHRKLGARPKSTSSRCDIIALLITRPQQVVDGYTMVVHSSSVTYMSGRHGDEDFMDTLRLPYGDGRLRSKPVKGNRYMAIGVYYSVFMIER